MNPTTTGAAVGITGAAVTLVCWALLGFPVHDIPDVPPQIEAIASAIVAAGAWGGHSLYLLISQLRGAKKETANVP